MVRRQYCESSIVVEGIDGLLISKVCAPIQASSAHLTFDWSKAVVDLQIEESGIKADLLSFLELGADLVESTQCIVTLKGILVGLAAYGDTLL